MISAPGDNVAAISGATIAGVRLSGHLPADQPFSILRAERLEASNRPFASNPLQSSADLPNI
jgi:hypothetical protein